MRADCSRYFTSNTRRTACRVNSPAASNSAWLNQQLFGFVVAENILITVDQGFVMTLPVEVRDESPDLIITQMAHRAASSGKLISHGGASGIHDA